MSRRLFWLVLVVSLPLPGKAQLWTNLLNPTYGSTVCNPVDTTSAGQCGWDWQDYNGIPGGIPDASWTQSGSTILASTYGNGSTDASSGIQSALNSCSGDKYVLLGAGTFLLSASGLTVPGGCVLRGSGASSTILNSMLSSSPPVTLGNGPGPNFNNAVSITAGATAGSTSITVSSASGFAVGDLVTISQLNDGTIVTEVGTEGPCTWCDGGETSNGTRVQGQTDYVTGVSGTTITLQMPLLVNYTLTPHATPYTSPSYAGLENLQIYANNTHGDYGAPVADDIYISSCIYCWVSGVEDNYSDSDHMDAEWSYRGEIVNSYFSNAFIHGPGNGDADVDIDYKSTGFLVQNNIMERLHSSIMLEWGAAGNVIAYNFSTGNYDATAYYFAIQDVTFHGAHPQFNLFEGNVSDTLGQDGIWGSAANNTHFRNWTWGTTEICNPATQGSRVTVTSSCYVASQALRGFDVWYPTTNANMIGNVEGSAQQSTQGTGVALALGACGGNNVPAGTPCGSGSRIYSGYYYNETWGYDGSSDGGGGSGDSVLGWNTSLIHGEYGTVNNSITWSGSLTHTLPASFYLTAKPSWWTSSIPWPAIGPDVTGGGGPGGHVYSTVAANPAVNCYFSVMGATLGGAGSPYTFNPNSCYAVAVGVTLTPTSYNFGNETVGTSSAGQPFTLANGGATTATITSIGFTGTNPGDFSQTNTCGASIASGGNCTISVVFTPAASGTRTATLQVVAGGTTLTSALTGTGLTGPQLSLSPASHAFGNQEQGTTSAAFAFTLSNPGGETATISSISVSPSQFSESSTTCGGTLAAAATCTINITFTPSAAASYSGTLTVADTSDKISTSASLTGTGTSLPQAATPTFSPVGGSYTGAQSVTISDSSSGSIICYNFTGSPGPINGASTCPSNSTKYTSAVMVATSGTLYALAGGASYSDSAVGSATYNLTVPTPTLTPGSESSTSPVTVTITCPAMATCYYTLDGSTPTSTNGTVYSSPISIIQTTTVEVIGIESGYTNSAVASATYTLLGGFSAAPSPVNFSGTIIGQLAQQTVTITSTNAVALTTGTLSVTGDYAVSNACNNQNLPENLTCTFTVTFTPTTTGARTGTITIPDNASGNPSTISLAGTGLTQVATPTFTPPSENSATALTVTISSSTSGATICYTTNGSTPTGNGAGICSNGTTLANGSTITVAASETVKAIGTESGNFADSLVGVGAYQILPAGQHLPAPAKVIF